jgi:hypothetical protein
MSNNNNNLFFKNETTNIKIVDERFKNNKKSIIIYLEEEIKELYIIIFSINKKKKYIKDKLFFALKYYSFSKKEYDNGKYLYKNRFIMNNTEIKINEKNGGIFYINWEDIKLLNTKDIKGKIKIDYYLYIHNIHNIHNIYNDTKSNYGLFFNFENNQNEYYAFHLINKNKFELTDINNLFNKGNDNIGNIIINLVAKFNELNGMENYVIYQPLKMLKLMKYLLIT